MAKIEPQVAQEIIGKAYSRSYKNEQKYGC